eukprot:1163101-Rhodomonas_salina.1
MLQDGAPLAGWGFRIRSACFGVRVSEEEDSVELRQTHFIACLAKRKFYMAKVHGKLGKAPTR